MRFAGDGFWRRVLEVSDVLVYTFDLEIFERPLGAEAYATESPWLPAFVVPQASVSVVARNAMGSVYAWCEREQAQACLHIDTRGTVAYLGDDLREVVALVVALPYWPEVLAQCNAGELASMRDAARRLEQETCEEHYALPAARQELQDFLQLPVLVDPVQRLHDLAIQPLPVTVSSPHGWRYQSPIRGSAAA
jgi:hypothetical protein